MGLKGFISKLNDLNIYVQIRTNQNQGNSGDYNWSKYYDLYACKLSWKWTVFIDVIV